MWKNKLVFWIFFSSFFCFFSVKGDILHLKNGNKIQGQIIQDDGTWLRVKVSRGVIYVRKSNLEKVEKEEEEDYRLGQTRHLLNLSALDEALEQALLLIRKKPSSISAKKNLKKVYLALIEKKLKKKHLAGAKKYTKALAKFMPKDPEVISFQNKLKKLEKYLDQLLLKANQSYKEKKFQKAMIYYGEVLSYRPEKLEAISPCLSSSYFQVGVQLYRQKKFAKSTVIFQKAMEIYPSYIESMKKYFIFSVLNQVRPLFRQQKFEKAEKTLQKALLFAPENSRLHFSLGDSFYNQKKIKQAISEYCYILGQLPPRVVNIRDLREKAYKIFNISLTSSQIQKKIETVLPGDWRIGKTKHFTVYYRNKFVGKRILELSEYYYKKIRKKLKNRKISWNRPCKIYIYPSRTEYQKIKGVPFWSNGITMYRRSRKNPVLRILSYQGSKGLFHVVIPHELGHVIFHKVTNQISLPLWLNEGIATFMENGIAKKYRHRKVRVAFLTKTMIPLKILLKLKKYPKNRKDNSLFYGHSYTFVAFLMKQGGLEKIIELAQMFTYNSLEESFQEVYQMDLKKMEKLWKRFIME